MEIAYINEDFNEGESLFIPADIRSSFYDDNDFIPTTSISEVVWNDKDIQDIEALDVIRGGAFNVTKDIAELIMSFDPYGVEVYPSKLTCSGSGVIDERYILAIDNLVDAVDIDKSIKITDVTTRFYLSEEKLKKLPESKKHVFKPIGMSKTFFSLELFEALVHLDSEGKIKTSITAFSFDISEETPRV
ncbi:imm11 family protein [Aliivibrio sifiae]|uniref:imm11 family protein n=1 Tax=Aliivibrio sifiae TaxID=566293 RepID=UPI003D0BDEFB